LSGNIYFTSSYTKQIIRFLAATIGQCLQAMRSRSAGGRGGFGKGGGFGFGFVGMAAPSPSHWRED
jgi:hypothetical protein